MDDSSTKIRILLAAEKLFALHGIDAMSLRKISSAAGQKNKTAAQYHFGDKEGLIQAIFAHRAAAINANRQQLLDALLAAGEVTLYKLIEAVLKPFIELLLDENGGRYYVHFTAQLFSQGKTESLLSKFHQQTATHPQLFRLISEQLDHVPKHVLLQRSMFMSSLLAQASATKDYELEQFEPSKRKQQIDEFSQELITFVAGGMSAPVRQ